MTEPIVIDLSADSHCAYPPCANLEWRRLTVTSICATLHAVSEGRPPTGDERERAQLRDRLCEISDRLASLGLRQPLVLVVECCNDGTYRQWHSIAGNQDWHRGSFAITPYYREAFGKSSLPNVDALIRQLTAEEVEGAGSFKLRKLSGDDFAQHMRSGLEGWVKEQSRQDGDEIVLYRAFVDWLTAEFRDDGQIVRGLEHWQKFVVQQARRASDIGPAIPMTQSLSKQVGITMGRTSLPDNPEFWCKARALLRESGITVMPNASEGKVA